MAKVYERLLSTNIVREKRRDSFDPQRVILLGEDIICMVNLLEIPRVIVFFYYIIDLLRLFQKRSFVLSSKHKNQNVATIGTLLDQLNGKKGANRLIPNVQFCWARTLFVWLTCWKYRE